MKIIGLDGKEYHLNVRESQHPMRTLAGCKSKLQFRCGQILRKKFPYDTILEELHIPGHGLYFDFFLPVHKMVFEIDGAQHGEYNPFFHKDHKGYVSAQDRDCDKESLCEINGFAFFRITNEEELEALLK